MGVQMIFRVLTGQCDGVAAAVGDETNRLLEGSFGVTETKNTEAGGGVERTETFTNLFSL